MKKEKGVISSAAFVFAAIFLFNPNINIIDVLPDFIGYFLIYNALSRISDLVPHFDEARDRFHKLFWITLSKIPAAFIMLSISSQNTAERPIIAVFSLAYAILELIYIFPAFKELFCGFEYLETRFGVEGTKKAHVPLKLTAVFFYIKMVCCTLPEFALTSVTDILGDLNYKPNIANFYPYFAVLGAIITIVLGIIWIVRFSKYTNFISKSRHIEFSLSSTYIEKQERLSQVYSYRFVCLFTSLIAIASLFGLDLFLDNTNYLPDIFSALLFIAAGAVMARFTKKARIPIIIGILYTFSSVCMMLTQKSFNNAYDYSDITKITAADYAYGLVIVTALIEFVFSVALFFSISYCISDIVKNTTGSPNSSESALNYNESLHKSFKIQAYVMAVLGTIASASKVGYLYLLSYTEMVEMVPEYSQNAVTMLRYGEFWLVVAVLAIVWIIYTYRLCHAIKEGAMQRFEIEHSN